MRKITIKKQITKKMIKINYSLNLLKIKNINLFELIYIILNTIWILYLNFHKFDCKFLLLYFIIQLFFIGFLNYYYNRTEKNFCCCNFIKIYLTM